VQAPSPRCLDGRYILELRRTPLDLIEKRVQLIGTLVGVGLVNADGVAPAEGGDDAL